MLKKVSKYGSTVVLLIILGILLVPSWRIRFQGWFQGLWMSELTFNSNHIENLPPGLDIWNITSLDGSETLLNDFYDRPILLSFWATWCPSCRAELAELKSLETVYKDKINVLAVSEESISTIKASELDDTYDFLYSTTYYPREFEISVYPTLMIIYKGEIIYRVEGAGELNTDKNQEFLNRLIENK